ncbi:hypothetical protein ZIOFF_030730 [Zingiber officinale]|uniref:J domain-containing protein n=1 Tax=Zingiber officinale TaxID=94328 RepID=A0A8J5L558_ZINOF|nr:hypothetical protein ZIOFF_030730 [Zingiber officinale]
MASEKVARTSAPSARRDPYEVLCVSRDSSDQEIKTAYRKLALKKLTIIWLIIGLFGIIGILVKEGKKLVPTQSTIMLVLKCFGAGRQTNGLVFARTKEKKFEFTRCAYTPCKCTTISAKLCEMSKWYHPDKNASNSEASELFKEVAYSYSILSDPEKRRQYDAAGFEALESEGMDMEIDLSNLGTFNTMFAALFSKLGVPIKTTISAAVLEEALKGTITVRPLALETSFNGKVDKQCAHFFGVTINDQQAQAGIVVRVTSAAQSKFKLLYFEEANGSYDLALQEDSEKTGKATSAGMYFLHFQVYHMDSVVNTLAMAKDPEAAFFKKLEGLQPCEVSELKPGTHIFAVYGDNFFKPATYTIEAVCAKSYGDTTEKLKEIESKLLAKRTELRQFEIDYRKALAQFQEVSNKYIQEKQCVRQWSDGLKLVFRDVLGMASLEPYWAKHDTKKTWPNGLMLNLTQAPSVDELLKEREDVHSTFTVQSGVANGDVSSSRKTPSEDYKLDSPNGSPDAKDKSNKKKWFSFNGSRSDKKG